MAITLAEWALDNMPVFDFPSPVDLAPIRRSEGGRSWRCETGDHKYHRDKGAARFCAWRALPMRKVERCGIADARGGELRNGEGAHCGRQDDGSTAG